MKHLVLCTSCKFRDVNNRFKNNKVTITAIVTDKGNNTTVSNSFICNCAKCNNCNKVLFTRMSIFKKLKKEAELYFKEQYNSDSIELKSINII